MTTQNGRPPSGGVTGRSERQDEAQHKSVGTAADKRAANRLVVDGKRPSVEWVAGLPADWTNEGERLVLFALACDAYAETSAPGSQNLAGWCGLHRSSTYEILDRLLNPTAVRPALVERIRGQRRTRYRLRVEVSGDTGQSEVSGDAGQLDEATTGEVSGQVSGLVSGDAGHALSLAQVVTPPVVDDLQERGLEDPIDGRDLAAVLSMLTIAAQVAGQNPDRTRRRVEDKCRPPVQMLVEAGWSTSAIVTRASHAPLGDARDRVAVLAHRLWQLTELPPPATWPEKCDSCDHNRMIETADDRLVKCPRCHPTLEGATHR